jgi:hypothetical protein
MIRRVGRSEAGSSEGAVVSASIRRWWLLTACFVTFMVSAAFIQSYTVFLVAFIETFRWSRGETSVAYAVSQFECRADQACDAGRLLTKIIVGAALGSVSIATNAFHAQWGIFNLFLLVPPGVRRGAHRQKKGVVQLENGRREVHPSARRIRSH